MRYYASECYNSIKLLQDAITTFTTNEHMSPTTEKEHKKQAIFWYKPMGTNRPANYLISVHFPIFKTYNHESKHIQI